MKNSVKEFIENNIDLIDTADWDKIYKEAIEFLPAPSIGEFSFTMIKAGIDPLIGLNYIPETFLYRSEITNYTIPDNILSIHEDAFGACHNLEHITLSSNIEEIRTQSFMFCEKLQSLTLPASVIYIGSDVFRGCDSLKQLEYEGSEEDWEKILKQDDWYSGSSIKSVICNDNKTKI